MARYVGVALIAFLCGCAGFGADASPRNGTSDGKRFMQLGVTVALPQGWSLIGAGWTQDVTPTRVAFASFNTTQDLEGDCRGPQIVNEMPADGAVLFVIDYGVDPGEPAAFGPRPNTFSTVGRNPIEFGCFGPSYAWYFRSGGRFLQVHLTPGPRADDERIREALSILNALEVRPR